MGKARGLIRKAGMQELLGQLPGILWAWVEATDSQLRANGASESVLELLIQAY